MSRTNVIELFVSITGGAKDLSGALASAKASIQKWADDVGALARQGALAFGAFGAAVSGSLVAAAKGAADTEAALAKVIGLLDEPDRTPAMIEMLRTSAYELSRLYGFELPDAIEGLNLAISSGIKPGEAFEFLKTSAVAAKAGVSDLKNVVDITTSVMSAYGMAASEAASINDSLFTAVKLGKTEYVDLANSLGLVLPVAGPAGVKLDELTASIAALTLSGFGTSEAVTGMRSALSNIIKPTDQATKMAEKLGIEFSAAALKSKGWVPFLKEINDAIAQHPEMDRQATLAQLFGDVQGLAAVLALAANEGKQLNTVMEAQGNKAGAAASAFRAIQQVDPTTTFKQIGASLKELSDRIGKEFLVQIGPMVEKIRDVAASVVTWVRANPELVTTLVKVARIVAVVALGISGFLTVVALAAAGLSGLLAIGLTPLLIVGAPLLALLAAVVAAGWLIWQNLDVIKVWWAENWPVIQAYLVNLWAELLPKLIAAWEWLKEALDVLFKVVADNWPGIKEVLASAWELLKSGWELLKSIAATVWDFGKALFDGIGGVQGLKDGLSAALQTGKLFLEWLKMMVEQATWLLDKVRPLVALLGKLAGMQIGGAIQLADSLLGGSKVGDIPKAASGGVFSGPSTGYLALLHGTEEIRPVRNGGRSGSGGGAVTVNVFPVPGMSPETIAQQVAQVLQRRRGLI